MDEGAHDDIIVTHREIYAKLQEQDALIHQNRDNIKDIRAVTARNGEKIDAMAEDVAAIDERLLPWDQLARDLSGLARFGRICTRIIIFGGILFGAIKGGIEVAKHMKWWS